MAHLLTREYGAGLLVEVFETKPELVAFMTDRFCHICGEALAARGRFAAALSGGKTPVDLYLEIGRRGGRLDWERIHVFLVDERYVPFDDSRSNFGMIRETLLHAVPLPATNVHPVATDMADPPAAAAQYEEEVLAFFGAGPGGAARFDLVVLGVGEDGHTASLFPGSPALREETHLVLAVAQDKERVARVTFTLPLINSARAIGVLATGRAKAEIVRRVVEERDPALPAALVGPRTGQLSFLCDREAASRLRPRA